MKNIETGITPERRDNLLMLAQRMGHRFKNLALLDQALRHSSYAHEQPETGPSNESLEFLGDAVLALAVSELLLSTFPQGSEGELSRRRAALVNTRHLAALARELELGAFLLLGRGEELQSGRHKPSLLADALEAVLAAVFLDGRFRAVKTLIERWFAPQLKGPNRLAWQDDKTALQELTQSRYKLSPTYHLLEESGPGHARFFRMELRLGERALAQGEGRTKKEAQQMAARLALQVLQQESEEDR